MPTCPYCKSVVEELIEGRCEYCLNSFICQSCGRFTLKSDESIKHPINCNSCSNKLKLIENLGKECIFNPYLYSSGVVVEEKDSNSLFSVKKQGNKPSITTFSFKK